METRQMLPDGTFIDHEYKAPDESEPMTYQEQCDLKKANAELVELVKDIADYLDISKLTSIGHGSILHRECRTIADKYEVK